MKRFTGGLILALALVACSTDDARNMTVSGKIDGLKKGTLFLQRIEDSTLVTLDSTEIGAEGAYELHANTEHPEVFFLYLEKRDNNEFNDRIHFFGEPGEITINSKWNAFDTKSEVIGSETHKKWLEYRKVMNQFNKRSLELARLANDPGLQEQQEVLDSVTALNQKHIVRGYLYALNFAINNRNTHLAPYIALTEVPDANIKYLDSIYSVLPPEVAQGKYGSALKTLIEDRKQ